LTNFRSAQTNFSRGEIAPHLYGRFDVEAWSSAVRKARNVMVLKYGGLTKRPGTQLVAEVLDKSEGNRLLPFQFSLTQTYALEMGQAYMAPMAGGGRIVEDELLITGITNAENATITAAYHGYVVGQRVFLSGIVGALGDLLNGRIWTVSAVVDASHFEIDVDTVGLAAFAGATGGITRTTAPDPLPDDPVVPTPTPDPTPPVVVTPGGKRQYPDDIGETV
jgi:hypothetical protein